VTRSDVSKDGLGHQHVVSVSERLVAGHGGRVLPEGEARGRRGWTEQGAPRPLQNRE
jgi:hypothetical protein